MPAPLQDIQTEGSSGTLSMTFPSALTSGSVIAMAVMTQGTGGVPTPSGFGVTAWTADKVVTTRQSVTIFSGTTNGSTATGSIATGYGYFWIAAIEMPANITLDTTATDNNQSANSSTGSGTPTASADVLLVGAVQGGENTTSGPTNSFTIVTGTGVAKGAMMYRNVASASGSYSSGMGTSNNYSNWAGALAVYKAGAAPPAQVPRLARGVGSG